SGRAVRSEAAGSSLLLGQSLNFQAAVARLARSRWMRSSSENGHHGSLRHAERAQRLGAH
ncbi:MAG TPA: hypothetical protein VI010_14085, partial [Xanthobacteraceae bacterium]